MTNWEAVYAAGCAVPAGRALDELTDELAAALRHPDPAVRDGAPYGVLRAWIADGVLGPELRHRLGDEMARRFTDPEPQARTFAPLVLDMLVRRGAFDPAWLAAFAAWYPTEPDLRGYDAALGWLHAVAHGADLLAAFGRCPAVEPTSMLRLAAARLLAPTDHVLREQEDDRLARAIALTLTRPELTPADAAGWLDPVAAAFAALPSGPTPAWASNAMRTLRALYVVLDRGVRERRGGPLLEVPHAEAVGARLGEVLEPVFQYS
ncbi:DUF2785 domain-containing protein [Georgenia thermotolerans]|uniref:DUF2785 domain-containing protein n=1 Tax=Georgenia thermotolerans TaxID=527326 RepID=A0A7J5UR69_9MICO|nr:DUF2785 domain-containing protein [Georgenia thermotolerans]KAE8764915.1 DUF2785 domain-containing protein [Georgenia thermotolerans]